MTSENSSKSKKKTVFIILGVFFAVIILCIIAVWLLVKTYLGKIDFDHKTDASVNEQVENSLSDEEIMQELLGEEEVVVDETDSPDAAVEQLEEEMEQHLKDIESGEELVSSEDVFNILLIGCDSREEGGAGRSDAIVLVSVNKNTKKIHMTSIMRDSYVAIPNKGNNRINAAYAFGGGSLLLDTIETNFAVEVDKYVAFDFYSFVDIVDCLGGIEIDVSEEEMPILNGYLIDFNALNERALDEFLVTEPGPQHLNGSQALCYTRIRHTGNGDFERTERQREVIGEIFNKIKTKNLLEMNDLLNVILPEIKTNLTEEEILTLLLNVMNYLEYDLDSLRLPVEGSYESLRIDSMAVLGVDLKKNQEALEDFIYN